MNISALREIELPRVLELIAALAASEPGRERVRSLQPATDLDDARARLVLTDELVDVLALAGSFDLGSLLDVGGLFDALRRQSEPLPIDELRVLFALAGCLDGVGRALRALDPTRFPELARRAEEFADFGALAALGTRLFDADGQLREDASPELVNIRRRLLARRGAAKSRAEQLLTEHASLLQETVLVQRGDRYCLPIKSEARARLPSLIHDRSGSGQTLFGEPLELVELNNDVAGARAEEAREIERLLREATARLAERRTELEGGFAAAVQLDAAQAVARFSSTIGGNRPELETRGPLRLERARHPLLDERLAELRVRALGEDPARARRVVPVTVEIAAETRVLLLTGPNAGGKTAMLKLIGLASALAQLGSFVPAAAGARLPFVRRLASHIGDSQDILADESSFSSYLHALADLAQTAEAGTLVLLDELGSATDPEEGGALAAAFLETLTATGATVIATSHLKLLKDRAARSPAFAVAAMELDPASGRPTFRLAPGRVGASDALTLAARAGVPETLLERARGFLGEEWARRQRLERELEIALERARRDAELAAAALIDAEAEREQLREQRQQAEVDARDQRQRFGRELDRLRRVVDETLKKELIDIEARVGTDEKALRRERERIRGEALAAAERAIELPPLPPPGPLRVGAEVELPHLSATGILRELTPKGAVVEVRGKMLKVAAADLVGRSDAEKAAPRAVSFIAGADSGPVAAELHLLGKTVEEAIDLIDEYLDRALLAGRREVRIIHGHGTGRLRRGVVDHLTKHPAVESLRPGAAGEGGSGATVVTLQ